MHGQDSNTMREAGCLAASDRTLLAVFDGSALQEVEVETVPIPDDRLTVEDCRGRDLLHSGSGEVGKGAREVLALSGPQCALWSSRTSPRSTTSPRASSSPPPSTPGRARPTRITVAIHPLSGASALDEFNSAFGRLAVTCTRATHGLLLLSRAGLDDLLAEAPARPGTPLGEPGNPPTPPPDPPAHPRGVRPRPDGHSPPPGVTHVPVQDDQLRSPKEHCVYVLEVDGGDADEY